MELLNTSKKTILIEVKTDGMTDEEIKKCFAHLNKTFKDFKTIILPSTIKLTLLENESE